MSDVLVQPSVPQSAEDEYNMEQVISEMQRLRAEIDRDQADIDRLKAETQELKAESRALLRTLETMVQAC